jgi:Putative auto-transporter adhesin, head GIN domain
MRRRWLLLAVVLALVGCTGTTVFGGIRGSGDLTTESRDVSGFTGIVLEGTGTVNVEITGTESLTIEAEDNLMPHLTSDVRNGRLVLGTDTAISTTRGITYTITVETLEGVTIDGSGNVDASEISGESFNAEINGSGTIDLTGLDLGRLEATISGSGGIDVTGTTDDLQVSIPGSGTFTGVDLQAATGDVTISGSGSAVVNVADTLAAVIDGSGSIEYLGNPTVDSTINGSGSIRHR